MTLLQSLKRQGECGIDGRGMIKATYASSIKQLQASLLVMIEILFSTTASFLNISARLVESQRKAVQERREFLSYRISRENNLFQRQINMFGPSQQEENSFFTRHFSERNTASKATCSLSTCR